MADDEQPLLGDSAADSPATVPQVGTLDVDLVIGKLLGYKNNPGKQVCRLGHDVSGLCRLGIVPCKKKVCGVK